VKVGLDEASAREAIGDENRHRAVAAQEARAAEIGVSGVPFFIVEERYAVSGAQPAENWAQVLTKAAQAVGGEAG
jgi:predicted DsbA family dithiol-disulfide isomerase